jgi:phosphoglycolate phosphatase
LKRKADHTPPVEGAIALLQKFTQAGVRIAIVSSDTTSNAQDFVDRYELNAWVKAVIGCDLGANKPDPDLFHQGCDRLSSSPASTLVIGDSTADIEMAKQGGAAGCLAVVWESTYSPALHQADGVMHGFSEIQIFT